MHIIIILWQGTFRAPFTFYEGTVCTTCPSVVYIQHYNCPSHQIPMIPICRASPNNNTPALYNECVPTTSATLRPDPS